jgi:uncharacterized RDD family membrane protein YckC
VEASASARAGFVSRLAAFFIDALILTFSIRSAAWLLLATGKALGRFAPPWNPRAILVALVPAIAAIYNILFWTISGQTPGKWLLGLRVVALNERPREATGIRHGLSLTRATLRLLGYVVSAMPLYAGFLAVLGPERRAWHDRIARTEVVFVPRQRPKAALAERAGRAPAAARPASRRTTSAAATRRARAT